MRRRSDVMVGAAIVGALVVVALAGLWFQGKMPGGGRRELVQARFREVGGISVGAQLGLRGVRVGRVEGVRFDDNGWILLDLSLQPEVRIPDDPVVIAAQNDLFGGWALNLVSQSDLTVVDTATIAELAAARAAGPDAWPGARLADIGLLTQQAVLIAGDVRQVTDRIAGAFDSTAIRNLRQSISELALISRRLARFAESQTPRIDTIAGSAVGASKSLATVASSLERITLQLDSVTRGGAVGQIVTEATQSSSDLRRAIADLTSVVATIRAKEASIGNVLTASDTVLTRMSRGEGTLGRLAADSALYVEATGALKELRLLLAEMRVNPKKYLKVSVF